MTVFSLPHLTPPLTATWVIVTRWHPACSNHKRDHFPQDASGNTTSICQSGSKNDILISLTEESLSPCFFTVDPTRLLMWVELSKATTNTFLLANLWNTSLIQVRHCSVRRSMFRLYRRKKYVSLINLSITVYYLTIE